MKTLAHSHIFILGIAIFSTTVSAGNEFSQFDIYCSTVNAEFQQSVTIGQGVRILIGHEGRSYKVDGRLQQASFDFIQQHLAYDGDLSSECANFLMTKGNRVFSTNGLIARVNFEFDKSELSEKSIYVLDRLLERLKYSNNIFVEGHTDSVGEKKYNFTLAAERAVAVANYMSRHPNSPYNLVKVSKGETNPIADNNIDEGRYLNRRVDIK